MISKVKNILLTFYTDSIYIIFNILRPFLKVKKNRLVFIANYGKLYGCNPKYISEYILNRDKDNKYEIIWAFDRKHKMRLDSRIKIVTTLSLNYAYAINTAGFVFNNFRTDFKGSFWRKSKKQRYIMTWHGGMPLKKIEGDVTPVEINYMRMASIDSQNCDLMMSSASYYDKMIRSAMVYSGEILKCGNPRNDIFFNKKKIEEASHRIRERYKFGDKKVVLYAPTFRTDHNIDCYNIDWNLIADSIKNLLGTSDYIVLIRLHPDLVTLVSNKTDGAVNLFDVSNYPDMQEIMCVADIMITDYSSVMFEFALMNRPCFIYATDIDSYDRGFYFNFEDLPFPISKNNNELKNSLELFDATTYSKTVSDFMVKKMGVYEHGNACEKLYDWMQEQ